MKTIRDNFYIKKSRKECPKCGVGVFLGEYKNPSRFHCGKCSYVESIEVK